jgi:heme/copper-type cytochrome/quinol oxidase subunit 2
MPGVKRRVRSSLILLAVIATFVVGLVVAQGKTDRAPQVIRLEARDVRFNDHNPTVEVRRGVPVELTIRNAESQPIPHDFMIAGLDVRTPVLEPGRSATLRFTPERSGEFAYSCPLHPGMMDGKLVVPN